MYAKINYNKFFFDDKLVNIMYRAKGIRSHDIFIYIIQQYVMYCTTFRWLRVKNKTQTVKAAV